MSMVEDTQNNKTFVKRPSVQRFNLNIEKARHDISDEEDIFEDEEHIEMMKTHVKGMEQIMALYSSAFDIEKRDEIESLIGKLKIILENEEMITPKHESRVNRVDFSKKDEDQQTIGSKTSAFTSSEGGKIFRDPLIKRKSKKSFTPRSNQERKSSRERNEKINPFPVDTIKNGYLSGLDDSEDELKVTSTRQKKELLEISNDINRCEAPDPIKMLSGNQNLGPRKWTRRPHSDKDLSYMRRRFDMGGDIEDESQYEKGRIIPRWK